MGTGAGFGSPALVAALALCLSVSLTGCGSPRPPTIVVSPTGSRADEPVSIRVTGLPHQASTDLAVTSTDDAGRTWSSRATFSADAQGTVDVATAPSTDGSYLGVSAMGLITSMTTADSAGTPSLVYRFPRSGPATFQVSARAGNGPQATTSFTQTFFSDPVARTTTLTMVHDGFTGTYETPTDPSSSRPAVLIIGGSEGGNSGALLAAALAERGIPALSVAYFAAPGLPAHLADIPLEYFVRPLRWLRAQPGIDRARVWVSGASYGSEAALLLGADYPSLVHGVVSLSGGNTVTCSLAPGGTTSTCTRPPWTRDGKPVPFTRQFNNPAPTDVPASVIGVQRIRGPVLAVCGAADQEWDACSLSQAVLDRHRGRDDLLLSYPDAGHFVDLLLPYAPIDPPAADSRDEGSTPQANADARADAWPKVIDFLTKH